MSYWVPHSILFGFMQCYVIQSRMGDSARGLALEDQIQVWLLSRDDACWHKPPAWQSLQLSVILFLKFGCISKDLGIPGAGFGFKVFGEKLNAWTWWQPSNFEPCHCQRFFQAFHPTSNLIGSKLCLKDYFHLILSVIPPDWCHHREQKELKYSIETVHSSCLENFSDTAQHPAVNAFSGDSI